MLTSIGIGIVITGFFGYLALGERELLRLAWASRRWIPRDGTIVEIADNSFFIHSASQFTTATRTKYAEDRLTVCYEIEGQRFTTTNYSFGAHCDQPIGLHHVGDHLGVYYDPADPTRAVIKKGVPVSLLFCLFMFVFGLVWTLTGLF